MTVVLDRAQLQVLVDGAVVLASLHANDDDAVGEMARKVLALFQSPERNVDYHQSPERVQ